ncbi:MAG: hypothetical protein IPM39_09830 [Chloroflexi bacterium]|jgi:hypothetical protein|nr:hypothetical protein [Chloroflexota bacterium]
MSDGRLDNPIYINGINGSTGEPLVPQMAIDTATSRAMTWHDLLKQMTGEDDDLYKLSKNRTERGEESFGVKAGVDPNKLEEAGWGIVYANSISDEIKEALSPLVNWRRSQANKNKELFKTYHFQPAYANPQRGFRNFMRDNDAAPRDDADPEEMPYYLLLVGDPEQIPYTFQYALDVNRAVGRIYFDTATEYANYAESVVAAERDGVRLPRHAAFWGVTNENDRATQLSAEHLVKPLSEHFRQKLTGENWAINSYLGEQASRARLQAILGGDQQQTPAFLLTASHGIGFNLDDYRLLPHQGALLGSDWANEPGYIGEEMYLAGEHLSDTAKLHGLIAFLFACYGAGTPKHDDFMGKVKGTAKQIAPRPIIAKLPQRMLAHPRGGALAVIGHVDRAWTFSFMEDSGMMKSSLLSFKSTLTELFQGVPIGHAFDYFNRKHASSSVSLVSLLDEQRRGEEVDEYELIDTWINNHDARDYIILGDPAVRLCTSLEDEQPVPSTLSLSEVDLKHFQPRVAYSSSPTVIKENTAVDQTVQPRNDEPGAFAEDFVPGQGVRPNSQLELELLALYSLHNIEKITYRGSQITVADRVEPSGSGKVLRKIQIDSTTLKPITPIRYIDSTSYGVVSAQDMSMMDSRLGTTIQEAVDRFSEQISRAMRNIGTLEILTYTSTDDLKNVYDADKKTFREEAQLKAVTLLSLDGDVKSMVPVRQVEVVVGDGVKVVEEIDAELLEIHKNMVGLAQENQARFFRNILEVAATLVNMGK